MNNIIEPEDSFTLKPHNWTTINVGGYIFRLFHSNGGKVHLTVYDAAKEDGDRVVDITLPSISSHHAVD